MKNPIKTLRAWRQDRKRLSMEKHELEYVRKLAREFIQEFDNLPEGAMRRIHVGQLLRLCRYAIKVRYRGK